MMMRFFVTIFFVYCLTGIAASQTCDAKADAVKTRGFFVGMAEDQAVRLYPNLKTVKVENDISGGSNYGFEPHIYPDVLGEPGKDLREVHLLFLDHRLAQITIMYARNWETTKDFVNTLSASLKLPSSSGWNVGKYDDYSLRCSDIDLKARTTHEMPATLEILIPNLDAEIVKRENDAKYAQKRKFRPTDASLSTSGTSGPCGLRSIAFPLWKLRLGMSPPDVKKIYRQFDDVHNEYDFHYPGKLEPADDRDPPDMPGISLDFLDNKTIRIEMGFRALDWVSLDEFALAVIKPLGLPEPALWARGKKPNGWQFLTMDCSDFTTTLAFSPAESKYEAQGTLFILSIKDYDGAIQRSTEFHKNAWKP